MDDYRRQTGWYTYESGVRACRMCCPEAVFRPEALPAGSTTEQVEISDLDNPNEGHADMELWTYAFITLGCGAAP